jgi:hypothetical protein
MKRKMYDYLISYTFAKEGYLTPCGGTIGISRINKINNFTETQLVREFIESQIDGAKNVAINNIMYLGRNRHEVQ